MIKKLSIDALKLVLEDVYLIETKFDNESFINIESFAILSAPFISMLISFSSKKLWILLFGIFFVFPFEKLASRFKTYFTLR